MRSVLTGRARVGVLWAFVGIALGATEARAMVWLGGVDPIVRRAMAPSETSDYVNLFEPNAPWNKAATDLGVLKTSTQFLLRGEDKDLKSMFAALKQRGGSLGVEALMLPRHGQCGRGIEGYSSPNDIMLAATRVKALGGTLSYVAMDEPLWFGHHYAGANACQSSIGEVAYQVAENVKALRQVFPEIQIGDIEPVSSAGGPADWAEQIIAFAVAYREATGTPLAFFHADIDWNRDWRDALSKLVPLLRAQGMRFGIIYNGDSNDATDLAWTNHAEERIETVEADPVLRPDDAILQTWMLHPAHMLPEDRPGTMTNLVVRYFRAEPHMSLVRQGANVSGRLNDANGQALYNMPVEFSAVDSIEGNRVLSRTIEGVVPPGAVAAVAALRVNTECVCSGSGNLSLGPSRYREGDKSLEVHGPTMKPNTDRIHVDLGKPLSLTGEAFPVTAGAVYTFEIPLDASETLRYAGYAAIIFLDGQHKEVRRVTTALSPSRRPLTPAVTDASGHFSYSLPSEVSDTEAVEAHFAGTDTVRGITVTAH